MTYIKVFQSLKCWAIVNPIPILHEMFSNSFKPNTIRWKCVIHGTKNQYASLVQLTAIYYRI